MTDQNKMPDEIWIGQIGGGKLWGKVTPETHPQNPRYTRTDLYTTAVAERDALRELCEEMAGALDVSRTSMLDSGYHPNAVTIKIINQQLATYENHKGVKDA